MIKVAAKSWRPTWPRMRGMIRSIGTSYLALGVTLWILPGVQASGPASVVMLAIAVLTVGAVLRLILVSLSVILGALGLLVAGILVQALILGIALALTPGFQANSVADIVFASWSAAIVAALFNWLFDAGSEEIFHAHLLGRVVRVAGIYGERTDQKGMLIIQLDGVSAPLMRQAITGGAMPTVSRWLRSGDYKLREWHTGLPATTPAGQGVLLHGDTQRIPSFRWYEKDRGKIMVANRPADAAELEARMSDGRGLLADGGVSVSNLFSGDAPTRLLTMSDARLPSRQDGIASFATSWSGFSRSLVVFVGQMIAEWHQGRRQRLRNVRPRVRRGGIFVFLRGLTTVVLRDLNVSIVAEQMARGASTIFVDFVDYDEVAHHAGPSRPEAMRTLDGLDGVLEFFEEVVREANRDYEIVLVSDHGQSQGATFRQLSGGTLHEVVAALIADDVANDVGSESSGEEAPDAHIAEQWGPANALLTGVVRSTSVLGRPARGFLRDRISRAGARGDVAVSLGKSGRPNKPNGADIQPLVLVVSAGSLAHLYLTDEEGRIGREHIDRRYPQLIDGLARHPHIGAVMMRDGQDLVVFGGGGWRLLCGDSTSGGEGHDPLEPYGCLAAADLIALDRRDHVGDIVLLGRHDPVLGDVTAFEELVGSHGGLGGLQTSALLIHRSSWDPLNSGTLDGIEVFEALVDRLCTLGLRRQEDPEGLRASERLR